MKLPCIVVLAAAMTAGARAGTVALWLFDEQPGIYPSSLLNDCGPHGYFLVLGRGGVIVPGRFGRALHPVPPAPFHPRVDGKVRDFGVEEGDAGMIRFGLEAPPRQAGRTVEPMTWYNATFAAAFVNGDQHLRRTPFANASDSPLNLGAGDWTVECWLHLDAGAEGEGVIYEIGTGPRGENDAVTRLSLDPAAGAFIWANQQSGAAIALQSDGAALRGGGWVHCAFVHDGAKQELRHYVNGRLVARAPAPHWAALPHGDEAYCSVGRDGTWGRPLPGALDELRVSDEARYTTDFAVPGSFSRYENGRYRPPALVAGPPLLFPGNQAPAGVVDLGSRKHLFLDDVLLAEKDQITFRAHPARVAEKVVDPGDNWMSVVEGEDGVIRLYTVGPKACLIVHTSRDGVHFTAPDLGRGDFEGVRNFVTTDPASVGSVFLDPNGPRDERW